jgi:hypothetical protein
LCFKYIQHFPCLPFHSIGMLYIYDNSFSGSIPAEVCLLCFEYILIFLLAVTSFRLVKSQQQQVDWSDSNRDWLGNTIEWVLILLLSVCVLCIFVVFQVYCTIYLLFHSAGDFSLWENSLSGHIPTEIGLMTSLGEHSLLACYNYVSFVSSIFNIFLSCHSIP